jgi:hypothetical protein
LGGYTVITPLSSTGSTEISGYSTSDAVVFDQTIPIPPSGPAGADVQNAVIHADNLLAIQSGQANTLRARSSSVAPPCLAFNPGGAVLVTAHDELSSYIAVDTPLTQHVNQYSTTLIAKLNGNQLFSQTLGAQFSDPSVQAAILSADALLTGQGATFGAPSLASGSTVLLNSQVSYLFTVRR